MHFGGECEGVDGHSIFGSGDERRLFSIVSEQHNPKCRINHQSIEPSHASICWHQRDYVPPDKTPSKHPLGGH